MSEFLDLYREKNRIKRKLRLIRKKSNPDEYWALKSKERELDEKLNQIINQEKK
jgi:hypothetical protein